MLICVKCGKILRCEKNGVKVRYGYYSGYFHADLYKCPSCGSEILTGFSGEILDFEKEVDYDFRESSD